MNSDTQKFAIISIVETDPVQPTIWAARFDSSEEEDGSHLRRRKVFAIFLFAQESTTMNIYAHAVGANDVAAAQTADDILRNQV